MKKLLQIEEAAITAVSVYFLSQYNLGLPFWAWFLLFFSPDIFMLGYLVNTKIGAYIYNLAHHRAVGIIVIGVGLLLASNVCIAIGILLFAHSSFDRMLGFGLKYNDSFKHTHLT